LTSVDLEFVRDAGGESIGVTEPYAPIGEYFQGIDDADIVLYKQDMRDVKTDCRPQLMELLNQTKAGQDDRIYDIFKTVGTTQGTDWFEGKNDEPDLALLDHIAVFSPSELPDHNRTFLRLVSGPEAEQPFVETADTCEDVSTPLFNGWKEVACANDDNFATIVGIDAIQSEDICSPSSALPQHSTSLVLVLLFFRAFATIEARHQKHNKAPKINRISRNVLHFTQEGRTKGLIENFVNPKKINGTSSMMHHDSSVPVFSTWRI